MTAEGWPEGQSPWTDFAEYLALRCENRFQFIHRASDTRTTKYYCPAIYDEKKAPKIGAFNQLNSYYALTNLMSRQPVLAHQAIECDTGDTKNP